MRQRHLGVAAIAVGASVIGGNLSNYAFQVLSGRALGPHEYGILAGLLSIMGMVGLASSALQTAGAREVATKEMIPGGRRLDTFARSGLRTAIVIASIVIALSPLITVAFGISVVTVLCLAAYLVPTILLPIGFGKMQGAEDFLALAAVGLFLALMKVLIALVAGASQLGVTPIMGGLVAATAIAAWLALRIGSRHGEITLHVTGRETRIPFFAFLIFWTLSFIDVALAPVRFQAGEAGQYAAASTLGRAVVWIPSLVALVVFPRLAARAHVGLGSERILRMSVLVSLALSLLLVAFLVMVGKPLFAALYGNDYQGAATLAWKLALAGIPLGLANLLLFEKLARRRTRFLIPLVLILIAYASLLFVVPATGTAFVVVTAVADVLAFLLLMGPLFRADQIVAPAELRRGLEAEFEHG
jgi:O-antigen/teichoic acid export membrane protein